MGQIEDLRVFVAVVDAGGIVRRKSVKIGQHLSRLTISFGAGGFTPNLVS